MARQPIENRRNTRSSLNEAAVANAQAATASASPPLRSNPANENDPSTAMMMRRLRRPPSYDVIWISFAIAIAWAVGCLWVYKDILTSGLAMTPAAYLQAMALLLLPTTGIMAIAYFIWRTQQLRHVSEILMQQAMRLINPQDIATDGLTSIAQTVRQEVELLVGGVEHALQRATALEEIVHKEVSAVERAFGSNEERIRSLVNGLESQRAALQQTSIQVAADAGPMLQRLESNTHGLNQAVNMALSTFGRIEEGLKTSTIDLSRTIDDVSNRTSETTYAIGQQSQQFERISTLLLSDFRGFSGELQTQMQSLSTTAANLGGETRQFNAEIKGMEQNLSLLMRQNSEALTGSHAEIANNLSQLTNSVTGQLRSVYADSAADLERAHAIVHTGMQGITTDYVQKLHAVRGEILDQLNDSSSRMVTDLDGANLRFHERFNDSSGRLFEHIDQTSNNLVTQLSASGTGVIGAIQQSAGMYAKSLTEVHARHESLTSSLQGNLSRTSSLLAQEMHNAGSSVNDLLVSTSGTIASHLKETADIVSRQMQDSGFSLASVMEQSGGDVTDKLITISGEFVQKLGGARDGLLTSFLGVSGDLISRLEDTSTAIFGHMQSTTGTFTTRLGGVSTELVDLMSATNAGLAEQLDATARHVTQRLATTTTEIDRQLGEATDRLDLVTSDAAHKLDGAANTTTGKLRDASDKFATHISGTQGLLADQLANAATDIDQRLQNVSLQLTGQLEGAGSRISERLEDVSSLVDKSIDKFNLEIENMMHSRRDMLDNLATDANRRATEVDKSMSNYMTMIEESLAAAEERARHLGRIVSDQTGAALANLEEQLRKLETNSGGQVAQAARALREQHERALSNMNEMLSSTASDFQQTAQDMRITAQQVVKDIDTARGELKRAVIDLPEETRNNADAMRRVVADQIGALNALAEVVRKQGGSLDYSMPSFNPPRAPAPQRVESYAPTTVLARPEPVVSAPRLATLAREIEGANTKLNISARDVVEAIEGQLPRDIERRFAGTDKGAYTKRLFESRGRKLIKALEGRYSEERLLRSRVQAYNRLFEKLLDTISDTEGGNDLMEEVLASDQGRIYMMLAEVAGRLPSQG